MKFRPLHDRILIKRIEEKETVKGGIIIPDTAKEKPQEGEVIAVGNGKKTEDGKDHSPGREGGRSHPLRQVLRHRNQDRQRRVSDLEGGRSAGRRGRQGCHREWEEVGR